MPMNNLTYSLENLLNQTASSSILTTVIPDLILSFSILGLIGFLGNTFTYLQIGLRLNPCCIYAYCSSIVDLLYLSICVFPDYIQTKYQIILPWNRSMFLCKFYGFLSCSLPQLANSFLILSVFDRFACTYSFTSRIHRWFQLKNVSRMILSTILLTCALSIQELVLIQYRPSAGCRRRNPEIGVVFDIVINGFVQPSLMLIFTLLTFRNIRLRHRRVGVVSGRDFHQIRNQFLVLIVSQVVVTSVLSIQWVIGQIYVLIRQHEIKTADQTNQMIVVASFTVVFYSLNNVKSFYFSILLSKFFRNMFLKGLKRLFARRG